MGRWRAAALAVPAAIACLLASSAGAAELLARNATNVRLAADSTGRALVTYSAGGRAWHVFVSGAVNARQPSRTVPQVKFTVDFSGGRGAWRRFRNTCRRYDGPALTWFVTGCKAADGSYWALQAWQRTLPNVGYTPWRADQKDWELHVSHWTGELAKLEVYQGWVGSGRSHQVFGRATYRGEPIHGFRTSSSGVPLDTFGRLVYLDTFGSQYGPGWNRENSFVTHNPSGMFCYAFSPYSTYPGYPKQRTKALVGNGQKHRLTLSGPGVTPDVAWVGRGLRDYDPAVPELFSWEQQMTAKIRELATAYGDSECGR